MLDLSSASSIRFPVFLFGLLTLLSWELARPHHRPANRRAARWVENLGLAAINGATLAVVCWTCFVIAAADAAPWRFGPFESLHLPPALRLLGEVVALDLLAYGLHRAYHGSRLLWRFHAVHHTDADLDVSTASRFHLGEVAVSGAAKLATFAMLGISPAGLVIFEMTMLLAAQFQHANIPLPTALERLLWWLVVPPQMHRIHHHPERALTDSNYGTILTVWDRMFGSLRQADREARFGIEDAAATPKGLPRLLALPFVRTRPTGIR